VAHRTVPVTNAPATAALNELLMGPTTEEALAGLHTQIPPATRVLGLRIHDGLAIVDLSADFAAGVDPIEDRGRLAQIVYTLPQSPTVDGVKFRVEGETLVFRSGEGAPQNRPQTRRSFEDVTPAVFVERPAVGDTVSSPLVVSGTANTFEAQFMIRVRAADGTILVDESAMATSGSGTRGTFNETVTFTATSPGITLEVYESSAASGLPIHLVKIPLPLAQAASAP
jgi:germination protein M